MGIELKHKKVQGGGHYYNPDGSPHFWVPLKSDSSKKRPTNVKDCKELGLSPSVSTIIQTISHGAGLDYWNIGIANKASYNHPKQPNETRDDYDERMRAEIATLKDKAPSEGTEIHGNIQHYYETGKVNVDYADYIAATQEFMESEHLKSIKIEYNFPAEKIGYGGTVDMIAKSTETNELWVVDWKSKDFKGKAEVKQYIHNSMQLMGYFNGLLHDNTLVPRIKENANIANVYLSRDMPGKWYCYKLEEAERITAFKCFTMAKELWYLINNMK